jgi:hypothetical protein
MTRAQAELFPGASYLTLSRLQCGAIRRRALELLAAHGAVTERCA